MLLFGPLSSVENYLVLIAFRNAIEYFEEPDDLQAVGTYFNKFRRFLNTIESFNNIPDYIFYEYQAVLPSKLKQENFAEHIFNLCPSMRTVRQVSNAYKHRRAKVWAHELQADVKLKIGSDGIEVDYTNIKHIDLVEEVFRYWNSFHNAPDKMQYLKFSDLNS